ncbi:MAG: hypothetical protein ACE5R6_09850 [Candidatus Heimdallarchaeota archaeon]
MAPRDEGGDRFLQTAGQPQGFPEIVEHPGAVHGWNQSEGVCLDKPLKPKIFKLRWQVMGGLQPLRRRFRWDHALNVLRGGYPRFAPKKYFMGDDTPSRLLFRVLNICYNKLSPELSGST